MKFQDFCPFLLCGRFRLLDACLWGGLPQVAQASQIDRELMQILRTSTPQPSRMNGAGLGVAGEALAGPGRISRKRHFFKFLNVGDPQLGVRAHMSL